MSSMLADAIQNTSAVLLAAIFCLTCVHTASVTDLSPRQTRWDLSNGNRSIVLPVQVPGYALQRLCEHKIVADPLHG